MQSWESFTNRYPRLRLSSFLSRKGIKSFDEAVTHFKAMGVVPCEEALRNVFGTVVEVTAATNNKAIEPDSVTPKEPEASTDLVNESAGDQHNVDESAKSGQAIKPPRRRTSRRKKSDTETPE